MEARTFSSFALDCRFFFGGSSIRSDRPVSLSSPFSVGFVGGPFGAFSVSVLSSSASETTNAALFRATFFGEDFLGFGFAGERFLGEGAAAGSSCSTSDVGTCSGVLYKVLLVGFCAARVIKRSDSTPLRGHAAHLVLWGPSSLLWVPRLRPCPCRLHLLR